MPRRLLEQILVTVGGGSRRRDDGATATNNNNNPNANDQTAATTTDDPGNTTTTTTSNQRSEVNDDDASIASSSSSSVVVIVAIPNAKPVFPNERRRDIRVVDDEPSSSSSSTTSCILVPEDNVLATFATADHNELDIELGATLHGDKERLPPPPPIDPTLPITPSRIMPLKKQGHKFLGCLCDVRRAVLIFNIFAIVVSLTSLTFFLGHEVHLLGNDDDDYFSRTDEDYSDFWSTDLPCYLPSFWIAVLQGRFGRLVAYLMISCTLLYSLLGVMGALRYNAIMVFGASCWPFVHAFVGAAHRDYTSMAISLLSVYPHVVLIYELHHKIITSATYNVREDYCLCRHPRQKKMPMGENEGRL